MASIKLSKHLTPRQRFLSTSRLMVFFIPFVPPPYSYITTLRGFIFLDESDKQTEEAVARTVGETLFSLTQGPEPTKAVKRFLAKYNDNIPPDVPDLITTLRFLTGTMKVNRLNLVKREDIGTGEGQSRPVWNLYIYPPSKDDTAMATWRAIIQDTVFVTTENGAGTTHRAFKCLTCRSINHPNGMCPYPKQPGWITPVSTTSPVVEELLNPTRRNNREPNASTRNGGNQGNRSNAATANNRNRASNTRSNPRT